MNANNSKKNAPRDHTVESLIASLVTISAFILVIEEPELLQSQNWLKIVLTALGTMFCAFLFGGIGFSAVCAFYTFSPNAKKENEEEQSKSIVERIIFWIVFLVIVSWLTLKFSGSI